MKKALSLILALVMALSLTVPVFAGGHEPGVVIAGTMLTADGIVSNTAITSGTVTYTAASDGNPAKLILNNAVISGPCEAPIISVYDLNLVIELIGNNQVTAGSNAAVISMNTELTITGSGSLIIHGNGGEGSVAIVVKETGGITLSEGCKMVGSTSKTETDISRMTEATFSTENKTYMVSEAVAQTVAIYNSNAASGKSGTTDITAVKAAAPLSYEMVIPSAVNMTEAGVVEIGTPSVENVENATENTVISYIATGTQLTLEGGTATMATSYYTDSEGKTPLTDDAIEVYKNSAVIASPTSLYVGVAETDWDAADAGTYKATVTFNFEAEEEEEKNEWVITFNDADLGSLEYWGPKPFTPATAEGATAETQYTYTIEGESSDFDIGYGQDSMTFAVLDSCPIECTQVTITVTFLEDATHKETSKSAVFTFNISG